MALSAKYGGMKVITLDPTPDCPCGQVADKQIVAEYSDVKAIEELAKESVPGSTCTRAEGQGPAAPEPPVEGSAWLVPPEEADPATDPVVLRRALGEAARLIEAADNCR